MKGIEVLRNHPLKQGDPGNDGCDISVLIGQAAINDLLAAHFTADPEFYDRTTTPIWQATLPAPPGGNVPDRFFKLYGKVSSPITVNLNPTTSARYAAFWRAKLGKAASPLPPNIELATEVLLVLNFTNRHDPTGPGYQLDYKFKIRVGAYIEMITEGASGAILRATDWDIHIDSLGVDQSGNPVPTPGDRIGTASKDPGCEVELKDLRDKITDLFDFAANYALTKIAKDFTYALPLPPIGQLAPEVRLTYGSLSIQDKALSVGALVNRTSIEQAWVANFEFNAAKIRSALDQKAINKLIASPARSYKEVDEWLSENIPEHRATKESLARLLRTLPAAQVKSLALGPVDNNFQIWTNGRIFDALAKEYLNYDSTKCANVFHIDVVAAYGDIDACLHIGLANASGGIEGSAVYMSCDVDLEGYIKCQICERTVVCGDKCQSYDIGLALKGPLKAGLVIDSYGCDLSGEDWGFLTIKPHVAQFPGLQPIGLPPIIGDLVDKVTNAVTSFILTAFLNALLSGIEFPVFDVPVMIPGTNVRCDFKNFKSANEGGYLKIGADPAFSAK